MPVFNIECEEIEGTLWNLSTLTDVPTEVCSIKSLSAWVCNNNGTKENININHSLVPANEPGFLKIIISHVIRSYEEIKYDLQCYIVCERSFRTTAKIRLFQTAPWCFSLPVIGEIGKD